MSHDDVASGRNRIARRGLRETAGKQSGRAAAASASEASACPAASAFGRARRYSVPGMAACRRTTTTLGCNAAAVRDGPLTESPAARVGLCKEHRTTTRLPAACAARPLIPTTPKTAATGIQEPAGVTLRGRDRRRRQGRRRSYPAFLHGAASRRSEAPDQGFLQCLRRVATGLGAMVIVCYIIMS